MAFKALNSILKAIFLRYLLFRVRSILVCARLAVCAEKHQKPDGTDERNKCDEIPPSALSYIVQTTNAYCQTRNYYSKAVNIHKGYYSHRPSCTSNETQYKADSKHNKDIEQAEIPVLTATGTAAEIRILLQTFHIPIH